MARFFSPHMLYRPRLAGKESLLRSLRAFLNGYKEFKVVTPYRDRFFSEYAKAEKCYLRSIYRRDSHSELWGRKFFQSTWECFSFKRKKLWKKS